MNFYLFITRAVFPGYKQKCLSVQIQNRQRIQHGQAGMSQEG